MGFFDTVGKFAEDKKRYQEEFRRMDTTELTDLFYHLLNNQNTKENQWKLALVEVELSARGFNMKDAKREWEEME